MQIEAEQEKFQLAHDLEMTGVTNRVSIHPTAVESTHPSLPVFRDDDIASYLICFERIANLLINPDTYAIYLCSFMTGKAVDIYNSLSPEITPDYSLKGFSKTPRSYRLDLKNERVKFGETYKQFSII